MEKGERRKKIVELLSTSTKELSGKYLATLLGVTRQVIVQDISILKSQGYDITSTARGYVLMNFKNEKKGITKIIAVKHPRERIREELECVIENGGKVLDVIVEHPLYGELRGNISIGTLDEVEKFMSALKTSNATPLLSLSNGVHLHTIETDNEESMKKVLKALSERHFLLK